MLPLLPLLLIRLLYLLLLSIAVFAVVDTDDAGAAYHHVATVFTAADTTTVAATPTSVYILGFCYSYAHISGHTC